LDAPVDFLGGMIEDVEEDEREEDQARGTEKRINESEFVVVGRREKEKGKGRRPRGIRDL
jgi:hypothetical protein